MKSWLLSYVSALLPVLGALCGHPSGSSSKEIACLHNHGENLKLACGEGQVTVRLKVKVGRSGHDPGSPKRCEPSLDRDCLGITPEVVAETNNCYFQQVCTLHLNPMMPITSSENRSCLARTTDYAIVESHQCICKDNLKYVCNTKDGDQLVLPLEGVLVSHGSYPWYYPKHSARCQVIFAQRPNYKLTLWSDDIDLDPEGRDNVSLYNATSGESEALIGEPLEFSVQGFNVTIASATVRLVFFISEPTKSGRGFLINYRWIPTDNQGEVTDTKGVESCSDGNSSNDGNGQTTPTGIGKGGNATTTTNKDGKSTRKTKGKKVTKGPETDKNKSGRKGGRQKGVRKNGVRRKGGRKRGNRKKANRKTAKNKVHRGKKAKKNGKRKKKNSRKRQRTPETRTTPKANKS